jgi:hypothetical protein
MVPVLFLSAIVQAKSTGPPFGPTGSGAGGGAYPQGLGNRNVQLTGKITF